MEAVSINEPVEVLDLQNLPELENERDSYMVKIDHMSIGIYLKSNSQATAYERGKESDKFYGEYKSKDELVGAFEGAIAEMMAESRDRVEKAKDEIVSILREQKKNDRVKNRQPYGALRRDINVDPTDREMENAVQALLQNNKIKELDKYPARNFVVNE